MSGRIPRAFIDDLLVRVDIVDLIDSHIPLKKSGSNFVARCPFHTEKTPSFSVNRNKQFYHCFGCGASGNAIGFLMDFNHLNFVEAVEDLATFAGLEVPRETAEHHQSNNKTNNQADLLALMERTASFYSEQLRASQYGKQAAQYLINRGISSDLAKEFMLGYAPDQWHALSSQFDNALLLETGLAIEKEGAQPYDRFRNRLMFPIRDKRGRTVGFGGRVLDNSLPKYLNSPETSLFHKSNEVYGLFELLKKNAKPKRILIVEGYMDVIALAQNGIHFAVATLGTATSQAHINLLFRFTTELVFCFDGDRAGHEAAWKAMEPAFHGLKDGRQIRIMLLPENHDPDSLVREEDADNFIARINKAETLSEYFFGQIVAGLDLSSMEGRAQLISKATPYLEKLPESIFKEMMYAKLKELSGWAGLDVLTNPATLASEQANKINKKQTQHRGRLSSARVAIALLIQNPDLFGLVEQREAELNELEFPGADILKSVMRTIAEKNPNNTAILIEYYRSSSEEKQIKALAQMDLQIQDAMTETVFCDAIDRLFTQARDANLEKLLNKEKGGGLNAEEKEQLRKMLAAKLNSAN